MTDLLNKPLVEKVSFLIYNIYAEKNDTFTINENTVYHHFMDDPDIDIIFEKINKLMKLMETEKKNGRFEELLNRDFETDIWFTL
jgi:hypothetical protein